MVRAALLALTLTLALTTSPGCGSREGETEVIELQRPLRLLPVDDPSGALAAVAAAVKADPESGLDTDERLVGSPGSTFKESFATGPNKHVLEDYIRTHPELAPPSGFIFAYERMAPGDGPPRWRMYSLRQAGGLELRKLASALVTENLGASQLRVRLDPDDGRAFATLTTSLVGQRLAIVQDGEVLMAPLLHEPITGAAFDISLADPHDPEAADAALARLLSR